jgi:hypothetical protein
MHHLVVVRSGHFSTAPTGAVPSSRIGPGTRERLPGPDGTVRSHAEIATDGVLRKPDGSPYSRQRVAQVEARALRKLGLSRSIAAAVHGAERAGRALHLMAGRRAVNPGELHAPVAVRIRLRRRKARWEVEHEAAVRAFLRSRV